MYNSVYVVGVCGKARVGKDTFATYLADELNRRRKTRAVVRSFASPIKTMLAGMLLPLAGNDLSLMNRMLNGDYKEKKIDSIGKSPRELLQTLGTEWGRDMVHKDIWMTVMLGTIMSFSSTDAAKIQDNLFVIIPDVRFDNEAEMVDELIQIRRIGTKKVACHTSEGGIRPDLIQATIDNDHDLGYLSDKATEVAKYLLGEGEL